MALTSWPMSKSQHFLPSANSMTFLRTIWSLVLTLHDFLYGWSWLIKAVTMIISDFYCGMHMTILLNHSRKNMTFHDFIQKYNWKYEYTVLVEIWTQDLWIASYLCYPLRYEVLSENDSRFEHGYKKIFLPRKKVMWKLVETGL